MSNSTDSQVRITTETHHDIGVHITYATVRPTKHSWHTIELDRHTIGKINPDHKTERTALHHATLNHYTQGPQSRTNHTDTTADTTATPTPITRAILQTKQTHTDETITRGHAIIQQIRNDRARRQAAMKATKARRTHGLLTDPTRSIFA